MISTLARLAKPCLLLGLLAADLDAIAGRQSGLRTRCSLRRGRLQDLRRQHAGLRKRMHADGAEMVLPADALGLQMIFECRRPTQRNLLLARGGVDVQILDVRELRALARAAGGRRPGSAGRPGASVVTVTPLMARRGRRGDVPIGDAGEIGAVGIDLQLDLGTLGEPVVLRPPATPGIGRRISCTCPASWRSVWMSVGFVARVDVGHAGDADFDRELDGIGLQLVDDQKRARESRRTARCSGSTSSACRPCRSDWMSTCA